MRDPLLLAALLMGLAWSVAVAQRPHPFDLLSSITVDGTGRVVGNDPIDHGTLRVWEDGQWRPWNLRDRWRNWSPVRVMSLKSGNLASLWHRGSNEWMAAWSRGTEILGEVQFSWEASPTGDLFCTESPDGTLWLSTRSPVVIKVTPPQEKNPAAARSWDLRPWAQNPDARSWHSLHAVPDDSGGIWLWSHPSTTSQTIGRLPGLMHRPAGADTWLPGPELPEGTEPPIRFVGNGPSGTLWIGDYRGRLLSLRPGDDDMKEFVPPPTHRLLGLAWTWPDGEEGLFALAGTSTKPAVWQWNKNGWERIISNEEFTFADNYRTRQSLLILPEGLLFGSHEGLIWLPQEKADNGQKVWGKGRLLNWETGFPLVRVEQILRLPDNSIGVRASREAARRWWAGTLEELLAGGAPSEKAEWIRPHRGWVVDAEDRVYTLLHERPASLQEWSQGVWRDIRLPEGINTSRLSEIDVDAQQRIVIVSFEASEPVLLLGADRKTWQVFPDYFTTLLELGNDAVDLWKGSHDQWKRSRPLRPARTPDGTIAFLDRQSRLHLWNGDAWRQWEKKDFFTPERLAADPVNDPRRPWLDEPERRISADEFWPPFVAEGGRLAFNVRFSKHTWYWSDGGDWLAGNKVPGPDDPLLSSTTKSTPLPRGADVPSRPRSVVVDNHGTVWAVAGGDLYRYRDGKTATLFGEQEVHPFLNEPQLQEARVDRDGFVWLRTGSLEYVLLRPPSAPEFTPRLTRDQDGLVVLSKPSPLCLEWSSDGDNWFAARGTRLGFLPPDIREVFLRLVAEDLTVHPLPSQVLADGGTPQTFWTQIVRLLLEGEHEKKILALQTCQRHPEAAQESLRTVLGQGRDHDDWWLRAALQAAQRKLVQPGHN